MSAVPSFDTLKLSRALQAGGFTAEQADATSNALADATLSADLATKSDLRGEMTMLRTELKSESAELRTELKSEIAGLRTELKGDISALRAELKADIAALKADNQLIRTEMHLMERNVTIRLGCMLVVAVGLLLAAMRYFPPH